MKYFKVLGEKKSVWNIEKKKEKKKEMKCFDLAEAKEKLC